MVKPLPLGGGLSIYIHAMTNDEVILEVDYYLGEDDIIGSCVLAEGQIIAVTASSEDALEEEVRMKAWELYKVKIGKFKRKDTTVLPV